MAPRTAQKRIYKDDRIARVSGITKLRCKAQLSLTRSGTVLIYKNLNSSIIVWRNQPTEQLNVRSYKPYLKGKKSAEQETRVLAGGLAEWQAGFLFG
jgi:hypothetical protein